MPERVFFEGGDPEFEEEKPDPSDIQIKRGRKLIRVGLLMLLLGLCMCLFFIILVVGVVPASTSSSAKERISHDQVGLSVVKDDFAKTAEGFVVERYTITNKHKMTVQVITFGARVVSLSAPDRHGKTADVILGCDNVAGCETSHLGGVVGRVSNGIAGSSFVLNGVTYSVSGNTSSWDKRLWAAHIETNQVVMSLTSADGEDGFPGKVAVNVTYRLTNDNKFSITYAANTKQKPTPINLSSRLFFNLAGEGSGTIDNHSVAVFANSYVPTNTYHIPTGYISAVTGTAKDLRNDVRIGSVITDSSGINTTYCLRGPTGSRLTARVYDADSGRVLTLFTNQPAVRFYTGDHLNYIGKSGHHYRARSGFLLETQNYPDAVHHSNFPDSVLTEGSLYLHEVVFAFTTEA